MSLTYRPMPSPWPIPQCLSMPMHHGMAGLERGHLPMAVQLFYQHLSAVASRFHLVLLGHLPQTVHATPILTPAGHLCTPNEDASTRPQKAD